jgi:hypothetical protein
MTKRKSAFLKTETIYGTFQFVPVWILNIVPTDIFPVKYSFKQRGYKDLVFSERIERIYDNIPTE